MIATSERKQAPYLEALKQTPRAVGPRWFEELRGAGKASFEALGFPSPKQEDWKYTSVEAISSAEFFPAGGESVALALEQIPSDFLTGHDARRLVFVNGIYRPQFSRAADLPSGVRVPSLAEAAGDGGGLSTNLGRHARLREESFVALNTAFMENGAVVVVPPGCRWDRPIWLVFVSTAPERPIMSHPRIVIVAGAASEATVIESYVGVEGNRYFCNPVTELIGGADAVIEHYRVQQESRAGLHVGTLAAELQRGCRLTAHAVTLGGALVRNNVRVVLDGEGAGCVLNGLYLGAARQHIDNFTEIEHVKPRASSSELYKGILNDSAHGVFNGKIVVHKDAQKSDARQVNKNLLLSQNAIVNTKPQLEIYADDVKCSHGSTIGQLDPDAVFYLRSRGIGVEQARSLLSFAFASDVTGRIKIDSVRRRLEDLLTARLQGRAGS